MNKENLFVRLLFLPYFKLDLNAKCAKNREKCTEMRVCLYKIQNVCTSSWITQKTECLSFVPRSNKIDSIFILFVFSR